MLAALRVRSPVHLAHRRVRVFNLGTSLPWRRMSLQQYIGRATVLTELRCLAVAPWRSPQRRRSRRLSKSGVRRGEGCQMSGLRDYRMINVPRGEACGKRPVSTRKPRTIRSAGETYRFLCLFLDLCYLLVSFTTLSNANDSKSLIYI